MRLYILPNQNMHRSSYFNYSRMHQFTAIKPNTEDYTRYGEAGASSSDTGINNNNSFNALDIQSAGGNSSRNSTNSDSNFMIVVAILLCVLLFAWVLRAVLRCFWSGGSYTRSNNPAASSRHGNPDLTQLYLAARVPNFAINGYGSNNFNSAPVSGMKKRDVRSLPIIFYSKSRPPKSANVNPEVEQHMACNPSSRNVNDVTVAVDNNTINSNNNNNIPAIIGFATSTTVCAICLADFAPGEALRVLPACRHCFHLPCIDSWLLVHSTCPTCRHNPILSAQAGHAGLLPCIKNLQQSDDQQL